MRGWSWAAGPALAVALGSLVARADGLKAAPCPDDGWQCRRAWLGFERSDELPIAWQFDSGWIPPSGNLQVHLWGGVHAETTVVLEGSFEVSWPSSLTLAAPGIPGGGLLSYHYGVEAHAQGKVQISVAGQSYTWQGDLPYVPQVDFQVEASQAFDSWAFPPGIVVRDSSSPQQVAVIDVASLIGPSIPGIGGGFELSIALDLEVRYWTERIVITRPDGTPVDGGPLLEQDGLSELAYGGGAFVDLDVHPEGVVQHAGVLHLIPAFYVSLLGNQWSIPLADVPIELPPEQRPWVFEPERVHVPLPDVELHDPVIDFGQIAVGDEVTGLFDLSDAGEADARVLLSSSDPEHFAAEQLSIVLDAGGDATGRVRFSPSEARSYVAALWLDSNDPDEPQQMVLLRGEGVGGEQPAPPAVPVGAEGGCGCRTARAAPPSFAWLALVAAALLRRRRPSAPPPENSSTLGR